MKKWIAVALLAPLGAFACLPADLGGAGTRIVVSTNDAGVAVGWWCPGITDPKLSLYAARWSAITRDLYGRIAAVGASSDKLAAIEQVRAASATTPLSELSDVWQQLRIDLVETRPPPSRWVVAPANANASPAGTRPTYTLTGTTLMATGRRVSQGSAADCTRHFAQGASTYCQVAPAPDVALVVRSE